jgi:quercetin 2,3-dioxygenase
VTTVIADQHPVTTLPGEPVPYVIEAGSGRAHVLLGEVGRALVGAEESRGAMSVMALDGPRAERPIPLHYHDHEYEFFYVLRGAVQLWADGESRVLRPGDFGYVPPGTVHAYQLQGHHSTFVGPIVPGGWDRFFDLTGEPFATAGFPTGPKGPPPFEKFAQAEVEFKMKYRPDLEYASARDDAADDTVPEGQQPFFLRSGEGPRRHGEHLRRDGSLLRRRRSLHEGAHDERPGWVGGTDRPRRPADRRAHLQRRPGAT